MRYVASLVTGSLLASGALLFACIVDDSPVTTPAADAGSDADANLVVPDAADGSVDAPTPTTATADMQILDLSSLRGQLDVVTEVDANGDTQTYGGLEALAGYFARDRATTPITLALAGGDVVGATPALSALFDDAPTVAGLNLLGVAAATFGAHDFERGDAFLQARIDGSLFRWVSSNITGLGAALGARPATPFFLADVGATAPLIRVAVLGITDPATASLVPPGTLASATVNDPVVSANAAAIAARAAGANVVVVVSNLGATGTSFLGATGPLIDFATNLQGVDVVFGGRTDQLINQPIGTTLVVQNREAGRTYARVKLHVEAGVLTMKTADVVSAAVTVTAHLTATTCGRSAQPACVCQGSVSPATDQPCPTGFTCDATSRTCTQLAMAPDPAATAFLKTYRDRFPAAEDTKVGATNVLFARDGVIERTMEVPLGDFIADAMRDQYAPSGARIALLNAGTITSGQPSAYVPTSTAAHRPLSPTDPSAPFDIVAGDSFVTVVPTTALVVRSISGQTLWQLLETSVGSSPAASTGFLQVSGLSFSYKASAAAGSRVQSVFLLDGTTIAKDDATLYTVVMTDTTSHGGDGFTMLTETVPTPSRRLLPDVLREYVSRISAVTPIVVPTAGRILKLP